MPRPLPEAILSNHEIQFNISMYCLLPSFISSPLDIIERNVDANAFSIPYCHLSQRQIETMTDADKDFAKARRAEMSTGPFAGRFLPREGSRQRLPKVGPTAASPAQSRAMSAKVELLPLRNPISTKYVSQLLHSNNTNVKTVPEFSRATRRARRPHVAFRVA